MSAFHNAPQSSSPTLWLLFWLCTCSFPAGGDEPAEMKRESQYSALRIVLGNGALTTSGLGGQMDLTFRLQGTVPGARYHIILQVLNAVTRKIDQQQRVTVSIHEDFAGEVSMSLLPPGEKRDKVRISIEAWSADVQAPSAKQRLMARHEAILPLVDEVHMQRYVNLTLTALARTEGWHDVKPSAVQVEDVTRSGNGGMRTYKLTAPTSAVALRVGNRRDENTTRRLIAVTEMMAAHGLTPRILATGRTWMIMEWKGGTRELSLQDEQDPEASFAAIGKLLARIHAIDTAWFDDHQHHLRRDLVAQHSLPQGDEASISRTALQRRLPEAETESPSNPLHVDPVCLPPPAFTPRSHPPDTALASPPVLLASAVEETLSRLTNASLPELSAWQRRARMRYKRRALSDVAISLGHACAAWSLSAHILPPVLNLLPHLPPPPDPSCCHSVCVCVCVCVCVHVRASIGLCHRALVHGNTAAYNPRTSDPLPFLSVCVRMVVRASSGAWATEDEAAGRRVTTHGDFHPHQIIYVPNPSGGASSLLVRVHACWT